MSKPYVSTQHGVKGESHDTVLFVAENNNTVPVVSMSKFFYLWSKVDVVLSSFNDFYYSYLKMIKYIENECGMKVSEIKLDDYDHNKVFIDEKISQFDATYSCNDYYKTLLKDKFSNYLAKKINQMHYTV